MTLSEKQIETCESSKWDFSDLRTLFLNCTLKRSPEMSHTQGLIDISKAIMKKKWYFGGSDTTCGSQHCLWGLGRYDGAWLGGR